MAGLFLNFKTVDSFLESVQKGAPMEVDSSNWYIWPLFLALFVDGIIIDNEKICS